MSLNSSGSGWRRLADDSLRVLATAANAASSKSRPVLLSGRRGAVLTPLRPTVDESPNTMDFSEEFGRSKDRSGESASEARRKRMLLDRAENEDTDDVADCNSSDDDMSAAKCSRSVSEPDRREGDSTRCALVSDCDILDDVAEFEERERAGERERRVVVEGDGVESRERDVKEETLANICNKSLIRNI